MQDNKREKALKILADIEDIEPSDTVYAKIGDKLSQVYNLLKEAGDTERLTKCQWDRLAFDLHAQWGVLYKPNTRFVPLIETSKGKYPDPGQITDEAFNYYFERAQESKNPVLKARYFDILFEYWENASEDKRLKIADGVVDSHLELAKLCETVEGAELLLTDCYHRAVAGCLSFNLKPKLTKIIPTIEGIIDLLQKQNKERYVLDLVEILFLIKGSKLGNLISNSLLDKFKKILYIIQTSFKDKKNLHLRRETLKIIVNLDRLRKNDTGIQNARLEFARSFEEEAEFHTETKPPSFLLRAHFLELAMREYMNIGEEKKFKELKAEIRKAYKKAKESGEFKKIEATIGVPKKKINEICNYFVNQSSLYDSLKLLANHPTLVPNVAKAEKEVEKEIKGSIRHLVSTTPIADDLKVADIKGEKDKFRWSLNRHILFYINIQTTLILKEVIDRLRAKKGLDTESLMEYFATWGLMDPENLSVIEVGFESYFNEDYVSALHILVPQFESFLRRLLARGGADITRFYAGGFEEKTFGSYLSQPEVKDILGDDLTTYISVVMTEKTGCNLRNIVAHGLLSKASCTRELADTVFHLFLILTRFTLTDSKSKKED